METYQYKKNYSDSYRADNTAAGAVAGLIAGACMGLFLMIVSASADMGFFHPVALAGGLFYGVDAILGGVGPVVTGIVVHLVATSLLGALFGALLPREHSTTGRATAWGFLFGIVSWGFTTFFALPVLNQTMKDRVDLAPSWWFFSFLVYGIVLGVTPVIRQSIGRQVDRVGVEEKRRAA